MLQWFYFLCLLLGKNKKCFTMERLQKKFLLYSYNGTNINSFMEITFKIFDDFSHYKENSNWKS